MAPLIVISPKEHHFSSFYYILKKFLGRNLASRNFEGGNLN